MSERSPEALHAALAILGEPRLLRLARRSALPRGMTLLLEVAARDPDAIREAQGATGSTEDLLTRAAGFFAEQVLLTRSSDSYHILGASSSASPSQLRRHMALISNGSIRPCPGQRRRQAIRPDRPRDFGHRCLGDRQNRGPQSRLRCHAKEPARNYPARALAAGAERR